MNDEDMPQLRLNPAYKRLLTKDTNDKDTRNYVKERYKSAIQLIKNIEQRKQTIMKVCYSIVARQQDFLERGIDQLKPMMIKEVAEEIGVHPSTVSRAVANKYAHTPQGVFELRYFFSESVQGPEGGNTSLLILKRRVKKLIEEEDPARPLTDEQITRILQSQGIQVTRRTVAKYREDMKHPEYAPAKSKEIVPRTTELSPGLQSWVRSIWLRSPVGTTRAKSMASAMRNTCSTGCLSPDRGSTNPRRVLNERGIHRQAVRNHSHHPQRS